MPYRGGGLALTDVMSGQVKFFFSNGSSVVGLIKGGKVKADRAYRQGAAGKPAGYSAGVRHDSRLRGLRVERGVRAARHADADRAEAQRRAQQALVSPEVSARFKQLNIVSRKNTPEEFHAFVDGQMKLWGKVVKDANIHLG